MKKKCSTVSNVDLATGQALSVLIYAKTWPKTLAVLEERQEMLLSDRALELLSFTITQLYLQGDLEDAKILVKYEELLAHARIFGITLAWENFMKGSL